jgi:hypothetical protein
MQAPWPLRPPLPTITPGSRAMDFSKLIARVRNILLTPKTEWPVVATEPATIAGLYKGYIAWVAAIPAIFGFLKGSLVGHSLMGVSYHVPIGAGIGRMVLTWILALVAAYVMMLIIDALAPTFGGQKSQVQALKATAYSFTGYWVASIGLIVPWIGVLIVIAGLIYTIYLLYLGLPATMHAPADKTAGYTAVTIIIAIVLNFIIGLVIAGMIGVGAVTAGFNPVGATSDTITIDESSPLGKLAALGAKMDQAGKQMDAAEKSGNADAQAAAAGKMMGALLGGGDQVEALTPDALKPFVPKTLAGLARTEMSAERNGAMGVQVSEAHGRYSDGASSNLELEITDMGGAKGIMALAGWAGVESEKETATGYEKTYKQDGRLINEKWDGQSRYGEYGIVLGQRFAVKVSGTAASIDQIKAAVAGLDLAGLEALKDKGVKAG